MSRLIAASLLVLFSASGGSGTARAAQPPEPDRLGLVGLVNGQSVAIHVVNVNVPPEPDKTAIVVLTLLDETGAVVASTTETIEAGHSALLVLEREKIPGNPEGRAMVRGLQAPLDSEHGPKKKINLVTTLEVFDTATGKTSFVLQAPPAPD